MSLLNDKMAKFEIIKQKQDELISNRQQLRLSELSQPKYIGGYSSFSKANSPKNSAKASVGTFGSSEKTTASTLSPTMYKNNNDINNSNKFTSSPATPTISASLGNYNTQKSRSDIRLCHSNFKEHFF